MSEKRYTLVIPTYNRPDELGRLLRFLAHQRAEFRILVLDSSRSEVKERNAAQAKGLALDLHIATFDSSTPPWEKFWRGAQMIDTEFGSLCADDDLLLVSSVEPLIERLAQHPDVSVAHGWYFNFYLTTALGLTGITYQSPSIDEDDPLERLHHLFRRYEALTYGLYRTRVLQTVLDRVQALKSMLGRELLGGAITVAYGKAVRLPLLYIGRSLGPSEAYQDWHPIEFLLSSPQSLFDEYARYRGILLECLADGGVATDEKVVQLVDLAHLRYLSEYLSPEAIDYLIRHIRAGTPRADVVGGIWPILARKQGVEGLLQRSRLLRGIRDRFFPWVRGHHVRKALGRATYSTVESVTASGRKRPFEVYEAFQGATSSMAAGQPIEAVMKTLQGFE